MLTYILRRALYSIPVLIVASFLTFGMVSATFDPTEKFRGPHGPGTNPADIARVIAQERARTGTDKPLVRQYLHYMAGVAHGDFGSSWATREPVSDRLWRAFGFTLQIITWGVVISAIIAISIGVYSAVRQYSVGDYVFTGLAYIGIAMPPFWFALVANQFLALELPGWLGLNSKVFYFVGLHSVDKSGFNVDYLQHLFLPVMTLTVQIIASWSRFQRSSMLDVLSSDYVRTARAKGVPRSRVVRRHALRNALIPIVTVMALDIGALFGGLIITEKIYSIPGMGTLFLSAFQEGDLPVIMAYLIVTSIFIIVFNLLADVLYSWLDPRIRLS